ncbi:MAG: MBOAT family protein, partial [Bacteroidales bacterium]|nr:MBOAT family protein [Bacteroidales bacterium]
MVFSSSIFLLIFLPVFLLLYELSPKKIKNYTLLAASILFYAWGAPKFIFVLIGFTIINYFIVGAMSRTEDAKKQKLFLTLSIILNLLLLVVFKYSNLFVHSLNDMLTLLGMTAIYWKEIALPIGISFFIFQSITYSVDVYRKESMPARNYANYLLYI